MKISDVTALSATDSSGNNVTLHFLLGRSFKWLCAVKSSHSIRILSIESLTRRGNSLECASLSQTEMFTFANVNQDSWQVLSERLIDNQSYEKAEIL